MTKFQSCGSVGRDALSSVGKMATLPDRTFHNLRASNIANSSTSNGFICRVYCMKLVNQIGIFTTAKMLGFYFFFRGE